jgi:hypothetical protein
MSTTDSNNSKRLQNKGVIVSMDDATMDETYGTKLHLVKLQVTGGQESVLWPCVVFPSKEDLLANREHLFACLGHGSQEEAFLNLDGRKHRIENFPDVRPWPVPESVAYLLGKSTPENKRVVFGLIGHEILTDFQSQHDAVRSKYGSILPGLEEALSEAFSLLTSPERAEEKEEESSFEKMKSEPEFSESRLRFVEVTCSDRDVLVPWPAIIFHNCESFTDGLRTKQILSRNKKELHLRNEYIKILEAGRGPPAIFLFGDAPDGCKAMTIDCGLLDYDATVAKAHRYFDVPKFKEALNEAMSAVAGPRIPTPEVNSDRLSLSHHQQESRAARNIAGIHRSEPQHKSAKRNISSVLQDVSNKPNSKKKGSKTGPTGRDLADELSRKEFLANNIQEIPSFSVIRAGILEKTGYSVLDNRFSLPGISYTFDSESAFREHLCLNGIRLVGFRARGAKPEIEADLGRLAAWVCYHRVEKCLNGRFLADVPRLSNKEGRALLEKTGLRWNYGKWHVPGEAKPFENDDIIQLLARKGLPESCDVSMISKEDQLRLEIFISCPSRRKMPLFT